MGALGAVLSSKVVKPLVAVVGAGVLAVVIGSVGLSSAEGSEPGVSLVATEDQGATLSVSDLEPGDSVTRTVTISNDADVASRLSFTEEGEPATFGQGLLQLEISSEGQQIYSGQFGAMSDFAQDMGFLEPRERTTFTFVVSLPEDAPYVRPQAETATASYTWLVRRP